MYVGLLGRRVAVSGLSGDCQTRVRGFCSGGGCVPDRSREDELNISIMDCLSELVKRAATLGQGLAQRFGLSMSDLACLHKLGEPMTMKELGQKMHCDRSFATMVANTLEKHGLVRRETSERDRRSKNIVLTAEGATLRDRLEEELTIRMPWAYALDNAERESLLAILHKMVAAAAAEADGPPEPDCGWPANGGWDPHGDMTTNT